MARPTDSRSVSVIGSQFISPKPLKFKIKTCSEGTLVITDISNKIILKVEPCDGFLHRQRWILDANNRPIAKLREKNLSAHSRWNVYRGKGKADSDIIFTTRENHMLQLNMCVNVYLGNKKSCNNDHHDFQIKGNWSKKNCSIYMGDSKTAIAQTNIVQPLEIMAAKKDNSMVVTINPNVDYAFVVALIAIVDAMNSLDSTQAEAVTEAGPVNIAGAANTAANIGQAVNTAANIAQAANTAANIAQAANTAANIAQAANGVGGMMNSETYGAVNGAYGVVNEAGAVNEVGGMMNNEAYGAVNYEAYGAVNEVGGMMNNETYGAVNYEAYGAVNNYEVGAINEAEDNVYQNEDEVDDYEDDEDE